MAEKTEEKKKGLTIKIPKLNPWMVATVILAGVLTFVLVGGWTITGQVVAPDQESIMSASFLKSPILFGVTSRTSFFFSFPKIIFS